MHRGLIPLYVRKGVVLLLVLELSKEIFTKMSPILLLCDR